MVVLFVSFETKRFDFKFFWFAFGFSLIEPTHILPRGLLPPNFFAMLEIRSPSLPEGGYFAGQLILQVFHPTSFR